MDLDARHALRDDMSVPKMLLEKQNGSVLAVPKVPGKVVDNNDV